ncbi:6-bladed beta-propeller [Bacteroides sp.]|uniref:6-bladed beta-propeller n=1 Tax=Bacteroides sp. TaxID=29523 RepID=UPI0025C586B9|nr:6-bladed beta-propeller [Bacteroides sp.]
MIITVSLLLLSCQPVSDVKTDFLDIVVNVKQEDSVADFFDKEYTAIPLETGEDFLIAQIDKIQITDSCIYVADVTTQGAIQTVYVKNINLLLIQQNNYRRISKSRISMNYINCFNISHW